jgi:ABC-type Zn uptake system ZnuABC Zn-binding protein ZnuA
MVKLAQLVLLAATLVITACQPDPSSPLVEASTETESATPNLVLTSVAPIHSIASALLVGTSIELINLPERARSLAAQPTWFAKQSEPFHGEFQRASAVVSMGNIWQDDSLYLSVREQNIQVINIDATLPYSSQLTGVSVVVEPTTGEVSPYFWLSPANIIRSAKIISNDLVRLFPQDAERIRANEQNLSSELLAIKRDFEIALANTDPYVYALADEFSYLTTEFGIYVEDYFIKQDINWTESDLAELTNALEAASIPVVIHKWEPSDEIQAAIAAAGSQLVVLDTFETSMGDINTLATANLEKLVAAFPGF